MNQYTGIYRRCELWFIRRELEQFGLQPLEGKIIMFLQDNQCTQEDIGAHFDPMSKVSWNIRRTATSKV